MYTEIQNHLYANDLHSAIKVCILISVGVGVGGVGGRVYFFIYKKNIN